MATAINSRQDLKDRFLKGTVPKAEDFAALIDSVPNIKDDELAELYGKIRELLASHRQEETMEDTHEVSEGNNILKIPADGRWHDLPVESAKDRRINGCRVYRIYASFWDKHRYVYSLIEATASHCNGENRRIISPMKRWWGWKSKIKLRWQWKNNHLYLQMKSRINRPGVEAICCRIDELWNFNNSM